MNAFQEKPAQAGFEKVLAIIQKLISIPSLSGNEEQAVKYLMRVASRLGFTRIGTDRMGNLIAEGDVGGGDGPVIVMTGHVDTVNADPNSWAPETRPWKQLLLATRAFPHLCSVHFPPPSWMMQARAPRLS